MTITQEVPELIPARMLNEYAYCPRLFFLEWVDQLWAPSSDTAEGDRQHRRVDAGGGAAPLPSEGEVKAARSVELSSERLGIIAKIDLLEGQNGAVVPVDTKRAGQPGTAGPGKLTRSRSALRSCCCESTGTQPNAASSSTPRRGSGCRQHSRRNW